MPFREYVKFHVSFTIAKQVFLRLGRRLASNLNLETHYDLFILEYKELSRMSEIGNENSQALSILNMGYFIPHYGIYQSILLRKSLELYSMSKLNI